MYPNFTAALFVLAKGIEATHPSTDEWTQKMSCRCVSVYTQ